MYQNSVGKKWMIVKFLSQWTSLDEFNSVDNVYSYAFYEVE